MSEVENEIDLMKYVHLLWVERKKMLIACAIGLVFGLFIAVCTPKTYSSKTLVAPEPDRLSTSNVSSIASMMGLSMDSSTDAIGISLFPDVIKSAPYLVELQKTEVTTRNGEKMNLFTFLNERYREPWWTPSEIKSLFRKKKTADINLDSLDLGNLPGPVRSANSLLRSSINLSSDKKTGKGSIAVIMQDPYVARDLADAVVNTLNQYMDDYRSAKSASDVRNLEQICEIKKQEYYAAQEAYTRYCDANQNITKKSALAQIERLQQEANLAYQVYSQVSTQLLGAKVKELKEKPLFVIIEPASVPFVEAGPSIVKDMIIFALLSLFLCAAWVFWGNDIKGFLLSKV